MNKWKTACLLSLLALYLTVFYYQGRIGMHEEIEGAEEAACLKVQERYDALYKAADPVTILEAAMIEEKERGGQP